MVAGCASPSTNKPPTPESVAPETSTSTSWAPAAGVSTTSPVAPSITASTGRRTSDRRGSPLASRKRNDSASGTAVRHRTVPSCGSTPHTVLVRLLRSLPQSSRTVWSNGSAVVVVGALVLGPSVAPVPSPPSLLLPHPAATTTATLIPAIRRRRRLRAIHPGWQSQLPPTDRSSPAELVGALHALACAAPTSWQGRVKLVGAVHAGACATPTSSGSRSTQFGESVRGNGRPGGRVSRPVGRWRRGGLGPAAAPLRPRRRRLRARPPGPALRLAGRDRRRWTTPAPPGRRGSSPCRDSPR